MRDLSPEPVVAAAAGRGAARGRQFDRMQRRFYWYCLGPALCVLGVIIVLPAGYLLLTSFTPLNLTRPQTAWDFTRPWFNYQLLLTDGRFHNSLWVQAKYSFWAVGLELAIGFLFALMLDVQSRFFRALRTIYMIPMVLPPIVVAIIWKIMYTPDISPLHWALATAGWNVPALITDPNRALPAVIIASTWQWFAFTMLMVLAALQMMPQEYVEAATIDGATAWQTTRYIKLPYVQGVLLVAGLFRLIDSIKAFPLIFVLTDGGPGNVTEVTNYYSFKQAFNFSYLGYSGAITVVLVAATCLLSWSTVRLVGWGQRGE
jgi:multiple sugar transport system permease protein